MTFLNWSKFNKDMKKNQCNEFFKSITTFYFAAIYNSSLSTNFFTRKIIILFTAYNFRYFYNETKKGWKKEKREYGRLESNKNTGNYNSNKTRSCGIYACMFLPLTTAHASHDREIKGIKNVFLEKEKRKKFIERFLHMRISFDKYLFMNLFISIMKNLWNVSKYTFYVPRVISF